MDFDKYQTQAQETDEIPGEIKGMDKVDYCIFGAVDQLGEIASRLKKRKRDGSDYRRQKEDLAEKLGFLLWYMATTATAMNIYLSDIAKQSLKFNEKRWRHNPVRGRDFDDGFPAEERLPDSMWVHFESIKTSPPKVAAKAFLSPTFTQAFSFGDVIDDNAHLADGYRFHDVFHLGYYAHLGWSPVVRGLLSQDLKKRTGALGFKRKSKPDVDRVEDGARARDREEAATVFIYRYAHDHQFFSTARTVDTDMLSQVYQITDDLEVRERNRIDWQNAIIESARVQKELMDNDGGWVFANRLTRQIYFSKSGP